MSEQEIAGEPFTVAFDANGLVPVVAQDAESGEVLLVAFMNTAALERTLAEGILVLWSRSRGALWRKGEQSGNVLRVRELRVNCEGNSLLARVTLDGAGACHEGYRSCYYRRLEASPDGALRATIVAPRVFDPAVVYATPSQHGEESADTHDASSSRGPFPPALPSPGGGGAGGGVVRGLGPDAAIERDARALYATYERLRGADLIPSSNTSKLLHAPDRAATVAFALQRAREELGELRGVLDGTHSHAGGSEDVILEASQVGYWTMLVAITAGHPYDAWRPHVAWLAGWHGVQTLPGASASATELAECVALLIAAGAICRSSGIHPARVVAADLTAMRAKRPTSQEAPEN
jgi:phosphoribosyl-AMP cyclohydrolase